MLTSVCNGLAGVLPAKKESTLAVRVYDEMIFKCRDLHLRGVNVPVNN